MRSRKPFLIFWPQYFEAKRSKAEGRRVPKKFAIERLDNNLLLRAAKQLGYDAQFEGNSKYPKSWWDEPGRILINTKGKKKSKVMIELAKEIKKIQQKT